MRDYTSRITRALTRAKRYRTDSQAGYQSLDCYMVRRAKVLKWRADKLERIIVQLAAEALEVHADMVA